MNRRASIVLIIVLLGLLLVLVVANLRSGAIKLSSFNNLRIPYYRLLYRLTDVENDPQKLKDLHQKAKTNGELNRDSAPCLACHGSMVEQGLEDHEEQEKAKHPIHQAMLTLPVLDFQCVDCHPKVDIRPRTPTHVTRKVDRKFCSQFPCHNPEVMAEHGKDDPLKAKRWLLKHPRFAFTIGISECERCHKPRSELDICKQCHLRGGFRPSSHRAYYTVPVNRIYPEIPGTQTITTRWKGFHFVFVREALEKKGVSQVSASNLSLSQIKELPCPFCHVLENWCRRCHIKHAPNWLDKATGHPARIKISGSNYCFKCHDETGAKCKSCHPQIVQ